MINYQTNIPIIRNQTWDNGLFCTQRTHDQRLKCQKQSQVGGNRSQHRGALTRSQAIHLANAFVLLVSNRNNLLSVGKASFTVLLHAYIDSPAQSHNLVHRDLDCISLPQDIVLVLYIDDIVLLEPSEQEVATTLNLLVRHLHVGRWEI